ncbi:unnamed protein product [Rotaria magnacalcarata]|uniref:Uncharacterized protein n=1 Tax=Rotaria magnacalcarata TaxID=392030 RepID=A0A815SDR8_9BILA|nr:unnamed protein product [Rotaria magnacalcarata]CAF1669346.1 unnamed protein product [Rotaria magnacalcarata]CAF2066661.1 unnamed protein product [Rotaria magnacalcarata]CAF4034857.1 unnamed protein product [Rotaria magnacalcarata]CAF4625965.1 unnamed protein product [Rotaria magnacalcarata]
MSTFPIILLLFLSNTLASESNITQHGTDVVEVKNVELKQRSYSHNLILDHSIHQRYQDPLNYYIGVPSEVFTKIPGLTFTVHHTKPMLYRLSFQALCTVSARGSNGFLRFLIDGRVLISNYLLPNNDKRQTSAPELGDSVLNIDHRGGGVLYTGDSPGAGLACLKWDDVYMREGTHIVEVSGRTGFGVLRVIGGQLSVDLIQYDSTANIQLPFPIIR